MFLNQKTQPHYLTVEGKGYPARKALHPQI